MTEYFTGRILSCFPFPLPNTINVLFDGVHASCEPALELFSQEVSFCIMVFQKYAQKEEEVEPLKILCLLS